MTVTCPFNSKFRENLKSKSSIGMSFASNNRVGGQHSKSTNRQTPLGWGWRKPDSQCREHENLFLRTRTSLSVPCSQPTHCFLSLLFLYLGVFSPEVRRQNAYFIRLGTYKEI